MSVSRRQALLFGAALPPAALLADLAGAQTAPQALPQNLPTGPTGQAKDPLVAGCLLIGGRKQIENCTWAMKKLQSDDVKAFARAEIDEHEGVKRKLKELGFDYPVAPVAAAASIATTDAAAGDVQPAGGAVTDRGGDTLPAAWVVNVGRSALPLEAACLIALDHEISENCIRNYRKEMDQYAGTKFDKRFVGHQLDEHLSLLDKVQAFRRHTTAAVQPVLEEGQKTIEKHIEACKALMDRLEGMKD